MTECVLNCYVMTQLLRMPKAYHLITGESHSFQKPSAQVTSLRVPPPSSPQGVAGGGDALAEPPMAVCTSQ